MNAPSAVPQGDRRLALWLAGLAAVAAGAWSVANHLTFGTNVFDSGVIDHALWRVTHGFDDVSSLNGRPLFADHPSGVLLVFLPIYQLAPSLALPVYFVVRAVSAGLVVWAAWLITDHLALDRVTRWVLIVATAIGPGFIFVVAAEANTVGVVVGPLAMAIALAVREGSLRWFAVLVGIVALSRPEVALGVVVLGLVLRRRYRAYAGVALWVGSVLSLVGIVWLVSAGDAPGFSGHLGHLGDSFGEAAGNALRRPWDALEPLFDTTPWASLVIWLGGFGLALPMLRAGWLLPAAPLLAIPFLGTWEQADGHIWQYWHLLWPLGMVAAAFAAATTRLEPRHVRFLVAGFVPLMWLIGIGPLGARLLPTLSEDGAAARVIVELIDEEGYASVSAPDPVVPHLTRRPVVHRFPVPFECGGLQVAGYRGPDRLPEAVMLHKGAFDGWEPKLAAAGYAEIASSGVFTLWQNPEPGAAPSLDCG